MEKIKAHVNEGKNFNPKEVFKQYKINKKKNIFDMRGFKYKWMSKHHPLSTIKVNMELTNGECFPFVVKLKDGGFIFDGGWYIIDEMMKYYDNNAKLWSFDFHEELCFPVDKRIKINDIKSKIYESDDVELETAINPKSLQKFMESTFIQKLLAGAEMEDSMRRMKMMMIIIIVVTGITLLLTLKVSGILGG